MMNVNRTELKNAMHLITGLTERSERPWTGAVEIKSTVNGLELRAARDGVECWTKVRGELTGIPQSICVDAKAMAAFVREAVYSEMLLTFSGDTLELSSGVRKETLYRTCPDSLMPAPREHVEGPVASVSLADLRWTALAMSTDSARLHLNGVLLTDLGALVATDGARLHVAGPSPIDQSTGKGSLIPALAITAALRLAKKGTAHVRLSATSGEIWISGSSDVYMSQVSFRLVDVAFPPYGQVMPTKVSASALVALNKANVKSWTRRLEKTPVARIVVNGEVELTNEKDSSLPAFLMQHEGKVVESKVEVGVNGQFMADALEEEKETTVRFYGELDPIRVDCGNRCAVVMPMRL